MKKEPPHKFTEKDVSDLVRTFGRPLPPGFKEKVLAKARAKSLEATPPKPTKKRQRGMDV